MVDELSILVTNARRTYLDALLAFADDTGLGSPAFSARRHLFHRVMLLSKEGEMSSLRVAVGSGLLVVALGAGTWGAANAFPLYADPILEPQSPPRVVATEKTYHQQAVTLFDKSRDPLLTVDQRLDLARQGIALEDKALAINPDYVEALVYKNIFLRVEANLTPDAGRQRELLDQADALRNRAIEIRKAQPHVPAAGEPPPPPPPPPPAPRQRGAQTASTPQFLPPPTVVRPEAPPQAPMPPAFAAAVASHQPVRIGGTIKAPEKIRDVKPVYPAEARAAGVEGIVIVEILVGTDGEVVDARPLRSVPILDEAALDSVRQWRFAPTIVDGTPRSALLTVTVSFRLQ